MNKINMELISHIDSVSKKMDVIERMHGRSVGSKIEFESALEKNEWMREKQEYFLTIKRLSERTAWLSRRYLQLRRRLEY